MTNELNDLLQPTVATARPRGPLPWRVGSQFWVAFLGGVPAVTAIAYINSGRLGMDAEKRRRILIAGIVAFAATLGLLALFGTEREGRTVVRIGVRVIAVVLYLFLARIQRDDDGRHQVFHSGEYSSLWIPGTVATVASAVAVIGIAFLIAMMLLQ